MEDNRTFSEREGIISKELQIKSIDERLENRLWNLLHNTYLAISDKKQEHNFSISIWSDFLGKLEINIPDYGYTYYPDGIMEDLYNKWYKTSKWNEKYDLIEFVYEALIKYEITNYLPIFRDKCNEILRKERAGYQFLSNKIVPLLSDQEIQEIEEAATSSYSSVRTHITDAIALLSDRKNPNYRNTIKESISAVEAVCIIITENPKAKLSDALNSIKDKHNIHEALSKSFKSLYGYTSDANGIRHALLEGDEEVKLEEAKFMLVSCSAFVNYLTAKHNDK